MNDIWEITFLRVVNMNDIWHALIKRLHHKEISQEDKVKTFLSLINIEDTLGPEEIDNLIIDWREKDERPNDL